MPELTCEYNYRSIKGGEIVYNTKPLEFPMPEPEIDRFLQEFDEPIQNDNSYLSALKWTDKSYCFDGIEMGFVNVNDIYDLNRFTQRLSELDDTERLKLKGLYEHDSASLHFKGKGGPYMPDIVKGVNLTHNLDGIEISVGTANETELGLRLVKNEMVNGLERLPNAVTKYLDYKKIGGEFRENNNGVFMDGSFVYNIPSSDQLQAPYQGKAFEQTASGEENAMGFDMQNM